MQGSPVVTSDDHKAGHVVGEEADYLIVETGTLRKHKHVLPKTFATERDGTICATVTWDILKDAPEVDGNGNIDRDAVAEHYGLAEHFEEGPEEAARAGGIVTAEQERVAIRKQLSDTSSDRPDPSPGITGGDRYRDAASTNPRKSD